MISALLLVACTQPAPPLQLDTGVEEVGSLEPLDLFDLERIHELSITVSNEGMQSLRAEPDAWVQADLLADGQSWPGVGLRVKGRSGSYRPVDEKPGLKIDLDHFGGPNWPGIERFNLENFVVDCSCARERLSWRLLQALGLPADSLGYGHLTLNGADYGLYGLLPDADRNFLERHWPDPGGNLYDGDYVLKDDGFETNIDFDAESQEWFALDEGQDVGLADVKAITAGLDATGEGAPFSDVGVDTPQLLLAMAGELWLGQVDGYGLQANNYRVYFDPADSRMDLIPWDMDFTFIDPLAWEESWRDPAGRLMERCLADAACEADFVAAIGQACTTADSVGLDSELDEILELIMGAIEADPRKECVMEDVEGEIQAVRDWIASRSEQVRREWGIEGRLARD